MQVKDKDVNNRYITIVCNQNIINMVDEVHWQLKKSKSEVIPDSVEFYVNCNLQDDGKSTDKSLKKVSE